MAVYASAYKKSGSGGAGLPSAVKLAIQNLQLMETGAATDAGGSITDPFTLDKVIDGYKALLPMVTDDSDINTIKLKIAGNERQRESLKTYDTTASIQNALKYDQKNARYLYVKQFASSPLKYLKAYNDSGSALKGVTQSFVDRLRAQNNQRDADAMEAIMNTADPVFDIYNQVKDYYGSSEDGKQKWVQDKEALLNYAVAYRTDRQGNVMDLKVYQADQVPGGFVPVVATQPFIQKDGRMVANTGGVKTATMDGMQVFVNVQSGDGGKFAALGGKKFTVDSQKEPLDINDPSMLGNAQSSMTVAKFQGTENDLEAPDFRKSLGGVNSLIQREPGTYFKLSDGRVFRNNTEGKVDEVSQDALKYFDDYTPDNVVRVSSFDSEGLMNRSGKLITEDDFKPYIYGPSKSQLFSGPQSVKPQMSIAPPSPEMGGQSTPAPTSSSTPAPISTQPTQAPVGPRNPSIRQMANRSLGIMEPSGSERFSQVSKNLFTGNPSP